MEKYYVIFNFGNYTSLTYSVSVGNPNPEGRKSSHITTVSLFILEQAFDVSRLKLSGLPKVKHLTSALKLVKTVKL